VSDKVEQALRMLSGPCPHNRPDSEAPRTRPNCLQCLSETAREVIAKEIEAHAESVKFDDARISAFYYSAAIARGTSERN
jgi:hypothetical protein